MNAIAWALNSVRGRGLVQTVKVAASVVADLSFDWQHGTSTMRWVDADDFAHARRPIHDGSTNGLGSEPKFIAVLRPCLASL